MLALVEIAQLILAFCGLSVAAVEFSPRFTERRRDQFLLALRVGVFVTTLALIGALAIVVGKTLWGRPQALLSPWSIAISAVTTAPVLFWLRGAQPALYGLVEIAVGATTVILSSFAPDLGTPAKIIAVASGVYVIVRGLDNIERDLPVGLSGIWSRLFPKKIRPA